MWRKRHQTLCWRKFACKKSLATCPSKKLSSPSSPFRNIFFAHFRIRGTFSSTGRGGEEESAMHAFYYHRRKKEGRFQEKRREDKTPFDQKKTRTGLLSHSFPMGHLRMYCRGKVREGKAVLSLNVNIAHLYSSLRHPP